MPVDQPGDQARRDPEDSAHRHCCRCACVDVATGPSDSIRAGDDAAAPVPQAGEVETSVLPRNTHIPTEASDEQWSTVKPHTGWFQALSADGPQPSSAEEPRPQGCAPSQEAWRPLIEGLYQRHNPKRLPNSIASSSSTRVWWMMALYEGTTKPELEAKLGRPVV